MQEAALTKAIERAGGYNAMGRLLGISAQAVNQWQRVPVRWVLTIEKLTGISRHQLRPDVYPRDGK